MQIVTTQFGALDTSALQNDRFVQIVAPGIYSGYQIRPNAIPGVLDITLGSDSTSTLVTTEGIIIRETSSILAAVTVLAADPNLERFDLVVAEYRRSSLPNNEQTYKVIKGRNQSDLNTEPTRPSVESAYQIPLAYIRVRPRSAFNSSALVTITLDDVYQVPMASWTPTEHVAALKPSICPHDTRRLQVSGGVFTNSEGTRFVEFAGALSSVIEDVELSEGSTRYYTFGVSDSGTVEVLGYADSKEELPDLSNDLLPVAIVEAKKIGGSVRLLSLTDARVLTSRGTAPVDKSLNYQALLANSIFKYMRIEAFDDDSGIKLSSVALQTSGEVDELTAEISGVDSSLTITWAGSESLPTEPVVITTEDLMYGGNLGTIKHFMLVTSPSISGLKYYYSGTSANGGFNNTLLTPASTVRAPGQGIRKLFVKFVVPPSAFAASGEVKIESFGVLMQLSDSSFNTLSLNELGLLSFSKTIPNLIANGDFYYWSKNQTDGSRLQLNTQLSAVFPLNTNSKTLADGWYVTHQGFSTSGETASRVVRDSTDFAVTTALELVADTIIDTANSSNVIEYRIPASQEMVGREITFAVSYESSQPSSITIGVAQMRRGDNGLEAFSRTAAIGVATSGEIIVSSSAVAESCEQLSFFVVLTHSDGATYRLFNARAASGLFTKLEYNPVLSARSVLRQYFERGRVFNATRSTTGGLIGASSQFGTTKAQDLGSIVIQLADESTSNRSTGVGELTFDADADGFVVTSTSTANGDITLDFDWEAYIAYEGTVV